MVSMYNDKKYLLQWCHVQRETIHLTMVSLCKLLIFKISNTRNKYLNRIKSYERLNWNQTSPSKMKSSSSCRRASIRDENFSCIMSQSLLSTNLLVLVERLTHTLILKIKKSKTEFRTTNVISSQVNNKFARSIKRLLFEMRCAKSFGLRISNSFENWLLDLHAKNMDDTLILFYSM